MELKRRETCIYALGEIPACGESNNCKGCKDYTEDAQIIEEEDKEIDKELQQRIDEGDDSLSFDSDGDPIE